jgi:hypothetical protein
MSARKTYFEQIPVAVVKKIAKHIQASDSEENVVFESPAAKTEPYAICVVSNSDTCRQPAGNKER